MNVEKDVEAIYKEAGINNFNALPLDKQMKVRPLALEACAQKFTCGLWSFQTKFVNEMKDGNTANAFTMALPAAYTKANMKNASNDYKATLEKIKNAAK